MKEFKEGFVFSFIRIAPVFLMFFAAACVVRATGANSIIAPFVCGYMVVFALLYCLLIYKEVPNI